VKPALPLRAASPRHITGLLVVAFLAAASLVGPAFTPDPTEILDPRHGALLPPGTTATYLRTTSGVVVAVSHVVRRGDVVTALRGGTEVSFPAHEVAALERRLHLLGTDALGRDVLSRLLHGGRVSLAVGASALALALCIGVAAGMAAGWRGGLVDALLMRLVDGLLAIPMIFLLLLLAVVFRPSLGTLVLVLAFSAWMGVARLVRAQVLSLKEREFVLAARAMGAGSLRIALTHLLPNTATPLAQDAALRLGDLILVEASLSFLGLGVPPPYPSWGSMVAEGQEVLLTAWWLTVVPGAAVAATVIGAALVADGLSEVARGSHR